MTVTKQQQLGWLVGFTDGCYVISQEEWQQERDKMQKQSAKPVGVRIFDVVVPFAKRFG